MPLSSDIADIEARLSELTQNATYPQLKWVFWNPLTQAQLPLPFVFMLDVISVWTLNPAWQTMVAMTCNVTKGEICCHRKLQHYVKSMPPLSQIKSVAF